MKSVLINKKLVPILFGLFVILSLGSSTTTQASEAKDEGFACAAYYGYKYFKKLEAMPRYDKFKHCTLSCLMAKNCGPGTSFTMGMIKEGYDALGFGDPDIKDLEADAVGVAIGLEIFFKRDAVCFDRCTVAFPERAPGVVTR